MLKESPPLSAKTICGGVAYTYSPSTILNFGISDSIYSGETTSSDVDLDKAVITVAFGVEHKY